MPGHFSFHALLQNITFERDRLLCYVTMCFGPMAFFGQARSMSVYLPLLAMVTAVLYRRDIDCIRLNKWSIGSLAFIGLYALASVLWSVSPSMSFYAACRLLPLIISTIILICLFNNSTTTQMRAFHNGLQYGYIFLILLVAIDLMTQGGLSNIQKMIVGKVPKWSYTHSSTSLIIICCFIWPIISYLRGRRSYRFAVMLYLLALMLPFTTQHMSARVSILSSSLMFLMVYKYPQFTLKILAVMVISYLLMAPFIHANSFEYMVNFWHTHLYKISHLSALHRVYIWSYVSDLIIQKPIWGWGLSAARALGGERHYLPPHYFELLPNHPHNSALHIWLELGLIGITACSIIILQIINNIRKMTDRFYQAAASAAFAGTLTISSVSFGVWQSWWFATLGLLVASFIIFNKNLSRS